VTPERGGKKGGKKNFPGKAKLLVPEKRDLIQREGKG